jgi:hypothetical protein
MWLLRYTGYCYSICDAVPPCRVHVHVFTIIQLGQTFMQILSKKRIHGNNGLENSYQPCNPSLCMQYRSTHPKPRELVKKVGKKLAPLAVFEPVHAFGARATVVILCVSE